jgi:3-ketosteroid 9alpha-monooxygenase subunit A
MSETALRGYPRGWFVAGFSAELPALAVKPLRYFGRDLVAFRGEDGAARVLDAFCPHLGAHLGHGGTVVGDAVRCPFHAWEFDGAGRCTRIPYAKKIPPGARVQSWPVREQNGVILVHHDPAGGEPTFEIAVIPEYGTDAWLPWSTFSYRVKTHPREIVENVADIQHFVPVHGTHVEEFTNEFDGPRATQLNRGVAYPVGGGEDRYAIRATYHGPGIQISHWDGFLKSVLVNAHTPVDEGSVDLRFAVSLKIVGSREKTAGFAQRYVDNLRDGFLQDVAIWEHKVFRERPLFVENDGPIGQLRRWYQQFYAQPTA